MQYLYGLSKFCDLNHWYYYHSLELKKAWNARIEINIKNTLTAMIYPTTTTEIKITYFKQKIT